jgi:hypothetical protein
MPAASAPNALITESYRKVDKVVLGLWGQNYHIDDNA